MDTSSSNHLAFVLLPAFAQLPWVRTFVDSGDIHKPDALATPNQYCWNEKALRETQTLCAYWL